MKTKLTEMWQEYTELVLKDVDPNGVQYIETKRAFMAGAIGMFENMKIISARYVESQALEKFNEIEIEAREWITEVMVTSQRDA
jgi:hypothetical protein